MGELLLPELWFARAHIPTEQIFKDSFNEKNCPGWNTTAIQDLHAVALRRIAELNTKMPGEWEYAILGWELAAKNETGPE